MRANIKHAFLSIAFIVIGMIASVTAQSFNGTVVGTIEDANGAPIAGAEIVVTQTGTNREATAVTNEEGEFVVPQLPPGKYKIKVSAPNFKTGVSKEFDLLTDTTNRVNMTLEAGNISEIVDVTAEPAVVNADNPTKGEVIVQRQVQELPLNGRDFTDLAQLVPGIYQRPSDDDQGQGLASAGTRTDSTNFTLDGVANRSDRQGAVGVNTSVDSIQEFKVSTSSYAAELGRVAGAQISVVSKSGSNRFSGSLFEYVRNDMFDATNALTPGQPKTLKRNQFGGTFGGPLPFFNFGENDGPLFSNGKNRTFFFASYEQTREVRSKAASSVAPNAAWRTGDFRNVRGAGADGIWGNADDTNRVMCLRRNTANFTATRVECPTPNVLPLTTVASDPNLITVSPIALAILQYLPTANSASSLDGYNFNIIENILPRQLISAKFDHRLSDKNNAYFRVASDNRTARAAQAGRISYPGFQRDLDYKQYNFAFGDTHSFRPNIINEFRVGYLSQNNKTINQNNDKDYVALFGIPGLPTAHTPSLQGFPAIRIDGYPDTGDSANVPFNFKYRNISIYDSVTWVTGNHTLKFGVDVVRPNYIESDIRNVRGDFRFRGRFSNATNAIPTDATPNDGIGTNYLSFADFLYGLPDSTQRQIGDEPANLKIWQSAFYVQDDWRIRPWLTLNLGLRYDYTPWLEERTNRMSNFIPELGVVACAGGAIADSSGAQICIDAASIGLPRALVKTDKNNLAPRFGMALKPFSDDKTVIRLGAGVFYGTETINPARQQLANNYPYLFREQYSRSATANITQITLTNPFPSDRASLQGVATPQGIPTDSQTPEIYQYSFTVERQLAKDLGLELGYVGSRGRHLGFRYNLNTAVPIGVTNCSTTTGICTLVTARRFAAYNDITYQVQGLNSAYDAGQVTLRRRSKGGLTMLASYTFSKAMDHNSNTNNSTTGSQRGPQNILDWANEWALADYHRTHQFSASFNWDLPFGRGRTWLRDGKGAAEALFGGWQLNGIFTALSGRPFTVVYSTVDFASGRPDLVGDPFANVPAGLFYNPAAFAHPTATVDHPELYGNMGRNALIGPGFQSVDMSLFKNFRLWEKAKLQFRWEVFNVLNRANYQIPQPTLEVSDTGQFRQTAKENREMQFALKFIF